MATDLRSATPAWAAVVMAVVAALATWTIGSRPELWWLDRQMQWLAHDRVPMLDERVVVVGIDDASLTESGVPLAIFHEQIGRFLGAMARARPAAVGFDVVLPERSFDQLRPGLDAALARGIISARGATALVLGVGAQADGSFRPLNPLFTTLAGPAGTAAVYVQRDIDGRARRFDERIGEHNAAVPTLAGQMARRLGVAVHPGRTPFQKGRLFRYVPLRDVLRWAHEGDDRALALAFADRAVLLGSLLVFDDQHSVAVPLAESDVGGTTHGVFIHAAQLRALVNDEMISDLPEWTGVAVASLLAASVFLQPTVAAWVVVIAIAGVLALGTTLMLNAGLAVPSLTWTAALVGGLAVRTTHSAWLVATERRRLRRVFDGFVSPSVLSEVLAGHLSPDLNGERRNICVVFADIRGFTSISEKLTPEAVTDLLNRYFERMVRVIHDHGGTLDKFMGDGLMAFFGAPHQVANPCADAFDAARNMLRELDALNAEQSARRAECIAIGIGLHYGSAYLGYVGSHDRHEYTAIGDTVNSASRLEGMTKEHHCPIVLSQAVRDNLPADQSFVPLGQLAIRGRAPIEAFGWKAQGDSS